MNWPIILQIATFTIMIGGFTINYIKTNTIKTNDLRHLTEDIKELKDDMKSYIKKLYGIAQRVSKIEGKVEK